MTRHNRRSAVRLVPLALLLFWATVPTTAETGNAPSLAPADGLLTDACPFRLTATTHTTAASTSVNVIFQGNLLSAAGLGFAWSVPQA